MTNNVTHLRLGGKSIVTILHLVAFPTTEGKNILEGAGEARDAYRVFHCREDACDFLKRQPLRGGGQSRTAGQPPAA